MASLEQIKLRLLSNVQLTPAETSLFLREMLAEVNKIKDELNELKVSASKPRVDSNTKGTVSAPALRRNNDNG